MPRPRSKHSSGGYGHINKRVIGIVAASMSTSDGAILALAGFLWRRIGPLGSDFPISRFSRVIDPAFSRLKFRKPQWPNWPRKVARVDPKNPNGPESFPGLTLNPKMAPKVFQGQTLKVLMAPKVFGGFRGRP
jgi:hypothetical protein